MSQNDELQQLFAPLQADWDWAKPVTFETAEAVKRSFGESATQEWLDVTKGLPTLDNSQNPWKLPAVPTINMDADVELPYATESLTDNQILALKLWENAKVQLNTIKEFEMAMRKAIVYDGGFFDADKTNGVEHVTLGNGYSLSGTKKETYKLDSEKVEEALTHFSEDEANMLVSWTATLAVTPYKKLSEEKKAFFNDCLTINTGAPTLEIKPPKVKA